MLLVLIGALTLFLELVFIRWMPANMFALAYFSNTVLLAAFLGLGLGFLIAGHKRDLFAWFMPVVLIVTVASYAFRFIFVFMGPPDGDVLWNFYYVDNWMRPLTFHMQMLPALMMAFVLSCAPFILLGQKTALLMEGKKPLVAYGLNTLGGLIGILLFAALSLLGKMTAQPLVWFALASVAALGLIGRQQRKLLITSAVCGLVLVGGVFAGSRQDNWSPYYDISVTRVPGEATTTIFVNRFLHQQAIDFTQHEFAREKYDLAYTLKRPESVLVLGAGSGNDVATALRNGATRVRAVEIDPLIVGIGKNLHPNRPYQDPRVDVRVTDARSYLRRSTDLYDMIVFGTLDSHALLSGLSTVRVENFVYTKESLQDARKHLTSDGVVVMMYSAPQRWLAEKITRTIAEAFEGEPILIHNNGDHFLFNVMVVAGPGVQTILDRGPLSPAFRQMQPNEYQGAEISTDNWPYLYLEKRGIPSHYVWAALMLFTLAAGGIILGVGKRNIGAWRSWQALEFFALGAAFLLLETKSVTTLSLLYGATWIVSAVVFGSITLMVCVAAWLMHRYEFRRVGVLYTVLGGLLLVNYLLPTSVFLGAPGWARFTVPAFIATVPLLAASLIFSVRVKHVTALPWVMGVNLLGVMFGGVLDYVSMITGQRFLFVVAGLLYLTAFLAGKHRLSESPTGEKRKE